MERKISEELLKWKIDDNKKPMLLYGISGCGKTYTILDFGKKEYKNTIYFDCNNNLELNYVFEKNSSLEKLIKALSAISLETILIMLMKKYLNLLRNCLLILLMISLW